MGAPDCTLNSISRPGSNRPMNLTTQRIRLPIRTGPSKLAVDSTTSNSQLVMMQTVANPRPDLLFAIHKSGS